MSENQFRIETNPAEERKEAVVAAARRPYVAPEANVVELNRLVRHGSGPGLDSNTAYTKD